MICAQCQSENSFAAIFCDHCGARLETACPKCGEPNRPGAKFCRNCGQLINHIAAAAPATVPGVPSPETYVPRHLAEKILASRQSLEGERKEVTVLFADIRGSTRLLEGLDPEDAQKLIDPVLRVMMDAVHRYEGTVNQVLGDGIMALFGAPLAHEDHAVRACYAALAMQEEMRRYRENRGQSEELGLQISIGLNSGEVVVRSISNDLNVDYSALGHTTHLAARMQELAGAGAILLTTATLREVEGFVEVKSLGGVQAKGVSRPIDAFELLGATSARTRLHAAVARGLTPFVGRKTEVETFQKLIEKSGTGRGQIFSMAGEPGMGKSRLVYEFTHSHVPLDWLVLEAPSVSYGKSTPYFPVIELLRRYFEVSEGEAAESIREKIVDHVLRLNEMLKDAIPPILALLAALPDEEDLLASHESNGRRQDVGNAIKKFNEMEPHQRRRQTFESLKRLMIRESQKQPLLLVFEDLHWIDNETQAFLDNLVESLPMVRMLLLVNYRPGYSHTWADKTYYTQLRVDPLQSTSAGELLQHLLGNNKELALLKESLIQRTEGNPFFAEESVRSLVETGILVGEKGDYRPGLVLDSIRIPRSVQNVVADRIDRLPIAQKHLLQTAAVIGVVVPFRLLRSVADLPEDELYEYLAKLQSAEFIYETNLFPQVEYSFKHALTNEVAYGALLHERRTFLHARTANALEEMARNTSQDYSEMLAQHAFQGELWEKAVAYLRQAGTKAMARAANLEAVVFFERALDALARLPDGFEKLEQAVDLRLELRNALFLSGEFKRLYRYLQEAESFAEALGNPRKLGRVLNFLITYYGLIGEHDQAIALGKRALVLNKENLELSTVTHYYMGQAYHFTGQYYPSMDMLNHALAAVSDESHKYERLGTAIIISVICRVWLVQCLAQLGSFQEGLSQAQEAIQIAEEANHTYSLAYAYCSLGIVLLLKGDLVPSITALEKCQRICEVSEIKVLSTHIGSHLGCAYALSGRLTDAMPLLEKSDEQSTRIGRKAGQSLRVTWHGQACLLAAHLDNALKHAKQALALAIETKEQGYQAWALKLLGDIAARKNSPGSEPPAEYYNRALALAKELGMRPLEAHCHMGLGGLYVATDTRERAHAEFSTAKELYDSMGMTFWLMQAEVALKPLATEREASRT